MRKKIFLIMLCLHAFKVQASALDAFKGVWTTVENFTTQTLPNLFKSLGASFGASPSGYVYSFELYNDLQQPIYFTVGEILSFMGGDLPKPHGITLYTVEPFKSATVKNQDYYFELLIKSTNKKYSSNMPYLPHDDVMLRHDAIALTSQPHSQKINYYRGFMGKKLSNGSYVHIPSAEYLGYINNNPADAKSDPGDVKVGSNLSSLTVYNSTGTDYFVGFIAQASATNMTQATCQIYTMLPAYSFGLLSIIPSSTALAAGTFADVESLTPGTIGIFDTMKNQLITTYNLPLNIFQNMPYTLEIYQDQSALRMDLQGLMSGNYDQPTGKVQDITPVLGVFWYQSVKQVNSAGTVDLVGKVWIIACQQDQDQLDDQQSWIVTSAAPGDVLQFCLNRPVSGKKLWLYFVYVATSSDTKAQQYCKNFLKTVEAQSAINTYHTQAVYQMKLAASINSMSTANSVPQSLLQQSAQGVLNLNGGQILDTTSGVGGYLLGADLFLPAGVGPGPMYYVLSPSVQNGQNLTNIPTSVVQNMYAASGGQTTAPSGMPEPTLVV